MEQQVGLIGFGEAGSSFALAGGWGASVQVFDRKTEEPAEREAMVAAYADAGVRAAPCLEDAIRGAGLVLSLVTADQALAVAEAAAEHLRPGALYCDLNSVAPQTKQAAARRIETTGAQYVDVAVMGPVVPALLQVPLLLSGVRSREAGERLAELGFANLRTVGAEVGRASAIKMIRSVMIKGVEALTAECMLAADAAGVRGEVLVSLDASDKAKPWFARADYDLGRMMAHGLRRAAEMEEVVKLLEELGTGAEMTRGTVAQQRMIGALGVKSPPEGLSAKIDRIIGQGATPAIRADAA